MSKLHGNLQDAVASIVDRQKQRAAPKDATPADLFLLRRELRFADVENLGRVYYYHPQSVAEKNSYQKHIRFEGEAVTISLDGLVDGIIARVKTAEGKPMFFVQDRQRLMDAPAEILMDAWAKLGAEEAEPMSQSEAEKK
jgi:hypothetical protein